MKRRQAIIKYRKTSLSSLPTTESLFCGTEKKPEPKKPLHFMLGRKKRNYSMLTNMGQKMKQRREKEEKYRKPRIKAPTKEAKKNILVGKFGERFVKKVMDKPKKYGYKYEHNNRRYFNNPILATTKNGKIERKIQPSRTKQINKKKQPERKYMTAEQHKMELLYGKNKRLVYHLKPLQ